MTGPRKIVFYRTDRGERPVQRFLDSLAGPAAKKILWVLKVIEDLEIVPTLYFKKLEAAEEIWECRILEGSQAFRILGFFLENNILVLTHGFIKKSRKTREAEIRRAERYRRDFISRRKQLGRP